MLCAQHRDPRASVERIADLVGESKWTVYKWMQQGSIPAKKIAGFELACGCAYVTEYLASSARKLVIDLPTGRLPGNTDIHAVQDACTAAIAALLRFAEGSADAAETTDYLTAAMTRLAHERAQVERCAQPELTLS